MPSARPIILAGCPRSGTTLLSVLLHAHPRIAMPPETRFLLPTYLARNSFGDLRVRANRRALARTITGPGSRFAALKISRREVVRQIVDGPPTIGSAMAIVWREFARSRGKQRWGEKRPMYWQHMDWIMRLFPDAQVIHLIRDPRACVASMVAVDWWRQGWTGAAMTWALADHELRGFGARARPGSYHALRYEDLLADPRGELTRLCGYLGEEFDEGMLQHVGAAHDIVAEYKTWHSLTKGPLDASRVDKWRTELAPHQVAAVEAVLGRQMARNGYRESGLGGSARWRDVAELSYLIGSRWARLRAGQLADLARQRHELQEVAADPRATSLGG